MLSSKPPFYTPFRASMDRLGGLAPVQARLFNCTALPAQACVQFFRESLLALRSAFSKGPASGLMSPDTLAVARSLSHHVAS
jgi:hypothetical protein